MGLDSFIKQIVERHELSVQLNTIVTSIDIPTDENDLIPVATPDNRHYMSKNALISIPLGCLKTFWTQFTSLLSGWKENAIEKMSFGLSNKIYIQFSSGFSNEDI